MDRLFKGEIPAVVRPWFTGATLAALPKPEGGLRSIAIGETLRRLTSKVAVGLVSPKLRQYFEPMQLGVGTPGGCEAIIHATRQWFDGHADDPDRAILLVDMENAFSCVDRSAVRAGIRRVAPELARWVDLCYTDVSHVQFGPDTLASARGVQQGDLWARHSSRWPSRSRRKAPGQTLKKP